MTEPIPTSDVTVSLADGRSMAAAMALPEGPGPHRGMVVLHEVFGLNADIRRITGRFAAEGYVSIAPDLYSHGNKVACLARAMLDSTRWAGNPTLSRIEAARRHLAARDDVDARRVGVVGFCMGGAFSLALAATGTVGAAGVNYGSVPKDRRVLEKVCPVVASYGSTDRAMRDMPRRLEDHLGALGVPHDIKVYEGVGHSFLSYDNVPGWYDRLPIPDITHAGYDEEAAEDAWRRMLSFFAQHLTA